MVYTSVQRVGSGRVPPSLGADGQQWRKGWKGCRPQKVAEVSRLYTTPHYLLWWPESSPVTPTKKGNWPKQPNLTNASLCWQTWGTTRKNGSFIVKCPLRISPPLHLWTMPRSVRFGWSRKCHENRPSRGYGSAYNQTPKRTSSLMLTMDGGWQIRAAHLLKKTQSDNDEQEITYSPRMEPPLRDLSGDGVKLESCISRTSNPPLPPVE